MAEENRRAGEYLDEIDSIIRKNFLNTTSKVDKLIMDVTNFVHELNMEHGIDDKLIMPVRKQFTPSLAKMKMGQDMVEYITARSEGLDPDIKEYPLLEDLKDSTVKLAVGLTPMWSASVLSTLR